jgi:hypothetical protein
MSSAYDGTLMARRFGGGDRLVAPRRKYLSACYYSVSISLDDLGYP